MLVKIAWKAYMSVVFDNKKSFALARKKRSKKKKPTSTADILTRKV